MKVALIRPVAHLRDIGDSCSNYHMVMAQDILENEDYRTYYQERQKAGDTLILDNGAAEKITLTLDQLSEAVDLLSPTYLTLPDLIQGGKKSVEHSFKALRILMQRHDCKFLGIPHIDPDEGSIGRIDIWLDGVDAFNRSDDIAAIGITKYVVQMHHPVPSTRFFFLEALRKKRIHKPIHLYGLSILDGVFEPILYRKYPHEIMGIDSSHYFLHAMAAGGGRVSSRAILPRPVTSWDPQKIDNRGQEFMKLKIASEKGIEWTDKSLTQFVEIISGC